MIGSEKNPGLYALSANEIFDLFKSNPESGYKFGVSYFEIYCGKLYDLLNEKNELKAREDKKQKICIVGLEKEIVHST